MAAEGVVQWSSLQGEAVGSLGGAGREKPGRGGCRLSLQLFPAQDSELPKCAERPVHTQDNLGLFTVAKLCGPPEEGELHLNVRKDKGPIPALVCKLVLRTPHFSVCKSLVMWRLFPLC